MPHLLGCRRSRRSQNSGVPSSARGRRARGRRVDSAETVGCNPAWIGASTGAGAYPARAEQEGTSMARAAWLTMMTAAALAIELVGSWAVAQPRPTDGV